MKYQTALKGLEFYAYHGLYEEEKVIGGIFLVDLTVSMDTGADHAYDSISGVVNYEILFGIAKEEMSHRRDLVETVAKSILDRTAGAFPDASAISVSVTKKNPAGLFNNGQAVITLTR